MITIEVSMEKATLDGMTWTSPNPSLAGMLNAATGIFLSDLSGNYDPDPDMTLALAMAQRFHGRLLEQSQPYFERPQMKDEVQ